MSIELKITGDTPEEIINQINGFVAAAGGTVAPATQLPTDPPPKPASIEPVADDEESDDDSERPDVDSEGLPFDDRIHSKAKEPFKADGTWKRRKGIDDDTWNTVRAELIAKRDQADMAPIADASATPAAPAATEATPATAAPAATPVAAPAANTPAPAPTPVPNSASSAAPPAPAPTVGRDQIPVKLNKAIPELNKLGADNGVKVLMALLKTYGTNSVQSLTDEQVPLFIAKVEKITQHAERADEIVALSTDKFNEQVAIGAL